MHDKKSPRKRAWINELKEVGLRPILETLEVVPQCQATERELWYINKCLAAKDCNLLNDRDVRFAERLFGGEYYKDEIVIYRHKGRDFFPLSSPDENMIKGDVVFINIPNMDGVFRGTFAVDIIRTAHATTYRARATQVILIHSLGIEDVDEPLKEVPLKEPGGYKGGLSLPWNHSKK